MIKRHDAWGDETDLVYLVAPLSFWDELPAVRTLTCGKVKFTDHRIVSPGVAFLFKAEAILEMKDGECIIRETKLGPTSWHYQFLLKRASTK